MEQKIKRQTEHLRFQVQTAEIKSSHDRHKVIHDLLQSSMATHPPQKVDVKLPFRFTQYCIRNDHFFGRDTELSELQSDLEVGRIKNPNPRLASVVLHGLGGLGKSAVALEYMYQHYDEYPVIVWLYADKKDKLDSQFAMLARLLGVAVANSNDSNNHQAVQQWITDLGKLFRPYMRSHH